MYRFRKRTLSIWALACRRQGQTLCYRDRLATAQESIVTDRILSIALGTLRERWDNSLSTANILGQQTL